MNLLQVVMVIATLITAILGTTKAVLEVTLFIMKARQAGKTKEERPTVPEKARENAYKRRGAKKRRRSKRHHKSGKNR